MLVAWAGPHGGPWFLVFPFLWFVVIGLLFLAFRGGWGWRRSSWHADPAESILADRYAKGEITAEEYEERMAVLRRKS